MFEEIAKIILNLGLCSKKMKLAHSFISPAFKKKSH